MAIDAQPRYPVRVVANKSGVSPHVLRAWERRHRAVTPTRSQGGQRLYSELDVERLRLLRRLTARGHGIGRLAGLSLEELEQILLKEESSGVPSDPRDLPPPAAAFRDRAVSAARSFEAAELRAILERATVTLGVPRFLEEVAAPAIKAIGHGWRAGSISVGQEHLATAVFRQVLGWIIDTFHADRTAPPVVIATLAGQVHELGALMAAAAAAAAGWQVIYLGADLPRAEIIAAARQLDARAIALSVVHPADHHTLLEEVQAIRQELDPEIPLFLGGSAVADTPQAFSGPGVRMIQSLGEFRGALRDLAASREPS